MNMFDKIAKFQHVIDDIAVYITLLVEKKRRSLKFKIKNTEKSIEQLNDKELDNLVNTYAQKLISTLLVIMNEQDKTKSE